MPLSRQARALLRGQLPVHDGESSPEPNAIALLFAGSRGGGKLVNWDRMTKLVQQASNTSAWHRHDIRRTVASIMGDLGWRRM